MLQLITIALGGAIGALLRHGANSLCHRLLGSQFAFGTLLVNMSGSMLLGWVAAHVMSESPRLPTWSHAGISVGLLGALTTFSTFGLDTWRHLEKGEWLLAAVNVGGNLFLGFAALMLGLRLGR